MEQFTCDYDLKDLGEIIQMVRCKKYRRNEESFASQLGVSKKALVAAEEGISTHGYTIIKKMIELDMIKANIEFSL